MAAEQDMVVSWLQSKGFFTISDIKVGSKTIDVLAMKAEHECVEKILQVEVCCSITGFADHRGLIQNAISEKFNDAEVRLALLSHIKGAGPDVEIERVMVISGLPKDHEHIREATKEFPLRIIEFENILADLMKQLNTSYYKNDVIRTLQIVNFILINDPQKLVEVLYHNLSHYKFREFLGELMNRDEIISEFKKTNQERLAILLKQAMIKPEKLAEMIDSDVLNQRTRKPFIETMLDLEGIQREKPAENKDVPLEKFFS